MIRRIEARNYRCLRHVDVELDRFQLAVGPNASGKSTLFDAVSFLSDVVRDGLKQAVSKRTQNLQDLVWGRPSHDLRFELAVEMDAPEGRGFSEWVKTRNCDGPWRYRHELVVAERERGIGIVEERGLLLSVAAQKARAGRESGSSVCLPRREHPRGTGHGARTRHELSAESSGDPVLLFASSVDRDLSLMDWKHALFTEEWQNLQRLQQDGLTAANVGRVLDIIRLQGQRDAVHDVFLNGLHLVQVESDQIRAPSSTLARPGALVMDSSNLPWMVQKLQASHPDEFSEWMDLVRSTLPDVRAVEVNEREDERTAYLLVEYANGLRAPSWVVSEGTLRFLLLSLLPFLPSSSLYLLEEPENGFHPFVLDAVYSSLACPGSSQVIAATHSTELVRLASPEEILCFRRDAEGATEIIRGTDHPIFRDADDEPDVRLLFSTLPFD